MGSFFLSAGLSVASDRLIDCCIGLCFYGALNQNLSSLLFDVWSWIEGPGLHTVLATATNDISVDDAVASIQAQDEVMGLLLNVVPENMQTGEKIILSATVTAGSNVHFNWSVHSEEFAEEVAVVETTLSGSAISYNPSFALAAPRVVVVTVIASNDVSTSQTTAQLTVVSIPVTSISVSQLPRFACLGWISIVRFGCDGAHELDALCFPYPYFLTFASLSIL